jgi:maltoporin
VSGFLINISSTNQKEFAMKNLILTCMVLFLVFVFGCQESSITDPTQQLAEDQDGQVEDKDIFQDKPGDVNHNLIDLKYQLVDPYNGTTYELTGQVIFKNTFISYTEDGRHVWVNVRLEMSAELSPNRGFDNPIWNIEEVTEENMLFTATGSERKKVKTYSFTNRDDIKLRVIYLISFKSVKVVAISLKSSKTYVTDDDATN